MAADQPSANPAPSENAPASPVAVTSSDTSAQAPATASGQDHSAWDQASLIGKVFIGFGALLTIASAARMFIA